MEQSIIHSLTINPAMRSILIFCLLATSLILKAQDSVMVQAHPSYDKVNDLHRKIFGENYRKEWAVPTKVPVIRISTVHGGLKPIERGGGQTHPQGIFSLADMNSIK